MTCPKEIKCEWNLEQRSKSLCNRLCTKDTAVICDYIDTDEANRYCGYFRKGDQE